MASQAPKCSVCNHHHEQGIACSICGHKGKGKVFQKLELDREAAIKSQALHFKSIDSNYQQDRVKRFIEIIRRKIFVQEIVSDENEEKSMPLPDEFDAYEDCSYHVMGYLGDGPNCITRWRYETIDSHNVAVIDRIGVLKTHRRRGIARKLLERTMKDIATHSQQFYPNVKLHAITAIVPGPETNPAYQLFVRSHFQPSGSAFVYRGLDSVRMDYRLP